MQVEAGVSHSLPVSVLLGTDVPQLFGMLPNTGKEESSAGESALNKVLAVMTRTKARRQEELSAAHERNEEASGIQPHALDDEVVESQPDSQERQESVPSEEAEVPGAEIVGSEFDHLWKFTWLITVNARQAARGTNAADSLAYHVYSHAAIEQLASVPKATPLASASQSLLLLVLLVLRRISISRSPPPNPSRAPDPSRPDRPY